MLERIRGKAVLCLILTIFWVGLILIHNPLETHKYATRYFGISQTEEISVKGGETLEQDFTVPNGGLMHLKCFVGGADAAGEELRLRVFTKGKVLAEQVFSQDKYKKRHVIDLEMNTDTAGIKDYTLEIRNISRSNGPGFVVYGYSPNQKGLTQRQPVAKLNGKDSDMSVIMRGQLWDSTIQKIYYLQWLAMIILSYLVVLLLNDSPSRNFLVIASVIGLLFVAYNPFWNRLDEDTHFFRSFAISEGYWHDAVDEEGNYGAQMPANFDDSLVVTLSPINYFVNKDVLRSAYSDEDEWYSTPYMSSVLPFDHMVASMGIKIGTLLHLSIVWVIMLARISDLICYIALSYLAIRMVKYYKIVFFSMATIPLSVFLAGSCSRDAVHISATFLFLSIMLSCIFEDPRPQVNEVRTETGYIDTATIKKALEDREHAERQREKMELFESEEDMFEPDTDASANVTAEASANVQGEAKADTANAGALVIPSSGPAHNVDHNRNKTNGSGQSSAAQLGGFATVSRPRKIGLRQIIGLLVLFIFVASTKYMIYSLLFLLVFFIPKERFEKPGMKKWFILAGIAVSALLMVYQLFLLKSYPYVELRNGNVDVAGQMAFVFGDFYGAFRILARYFTGPFLTLLYGIFMFEEFDGIAYILSMVILLSGVLAADKYQWENPRRRAAFHWVSIIIITVMSALLIAAHYVGYTPVGKTDVDGMQTCYLIPFLPLLGIVIADLPISGKIRHFEEKIAFIMVLANMMFLAHYTLIDRLFYWESVLS